MIQWCLSNRFHSTAIRLTHKSLSQVSIFLVLRHQTLVICPIAILLRSVTAYIHISYSTYIHVGGYICEKVKVIRGMCSCKIHTNLAQGSLVRSRQAIIGTCTEGYVNPLHVYLPSKAAFVKSELYNHNSYIHVVCDMLLVRLAVSVPTTRIVFLPKLLLLVPLPYNNLIIEVLFSAKCAKAILPLQHPSTLLMLPQC